MLKSGERGSICSVTSMSTACHSIKHRPKLINILQTLVYSQSPMLNLCFIEIWRHRPQLINPTASIRQLGQLYVEGHFPVAPTPRLPQRLVLRRRKPAQLSAEKGRQAILD